MSSRPRVARARVLAREHIVNITRKAHLTGYSRVETVRHGEAVLELRLYYG